MGKLANPNRGRALSAIAKALNLVTVDTTAWVNIGSDRVELMQADPYLEQGEYLVSARHGYFLAILCDKDDGVMTPTNISLVTGGPTSGRWKRITGFKIHASVKVKYKRY